MSEDVKKPRGRPKKGGSTDRLKVPQESPSGIIIMYKSGGTINHIEVDTLAQAKTVQATLNDWEGSHALTKFIYL